jgi:hypothetical protein
MMQTMRLMGLTTFRTVGIDEIEKAGRAWDTNRGTDRRRKQGKPGRALSFVAKRWAL